MPLAAASRAVREPALGNPRHPHLHLPHLHLPHLHLHLQVGDSRDFKDLPEDIPMQLTIGGGARGRLATLMVNF